MAGRPVCSMVLLSLAGCMGADICGWLAKGGSARLHLTSQLNATGATRPACSYMSPEVFTHYDVSPALDIYSFGIIGEHGFLAPRMPCQYRGGAGWLCSMLHPASLSWQTLPPGA